MPPFFRSQRNRLAHSTGDPLPIFARPSAGRDRVRDTPRRGKNTPGEADGLVREVKAACGGCREAPRRVFPCVSLPRPGKKQEGDDAIFCKKNNLAKGRPPRPRGARRNASVDYHTKNTQHNNTKSLPSAIAASICGAGGVFPARSRLNRAEDRPSSPRSVPGSLRHKFLREPFAAFCAPAEAALGEHSLCAKVHPPAPIPADRVDAEGRRRAEEEDRRPADRGEVEGAGGFPRQATFVALPSRPKRAKKYTSPSREDTRKHTAHSTHAQARGESSTHDACLESRRVRAHVPNAALLFDGRRIKQTFQKKREKERKESNLCASQDGAGAPFSTRAVTTSSPAAPDSLFIFIYFF